MILYFYKINVIEDFVRMGQERFYEKNYFNTKFKIIELKVYGSTFFILYNICNFIFYNI